jgi:hypothetical protein
MPVKMTIVLTSFGAFVISLNHPFSLDDRLFRDIGRKVAIYATKYGSNVESLSALNYDKRAPLAIRKAL